MHADTERLSAVVAQPPTPARLPASRSAAGHVPGSTFGAGRYRLLSCCGAAPPLEFWHGRDVVTDRDAGLTLVNRTPSDGLDIDDVFARTVWMCGVNSPAPARIVDMIDTAFGGVVVADWQPSCSLATAASVLPSRSGAARSARPLTDPTHAHLTVGQVAVRSGFVGPSQFGRAVRDLTGSTPRAIRRQGVAGWPRFRASEKVRAPGRRHPSGIGE